MNELVYIIISVNALYTMPDLAAMNSTPAAAFISQNKQIHSVFTAMYTIHPLHIQVFYKYAQSKYVS